MTAITSAGREGEGGGDRGGAEGEAALRVILVGRTGLDVGLRRERSIELARVGGAVDAVGELACAMEGSPRRAAVVVARDADPERDGTGWAAEFVASLRKVDQGTAVLLVDESRRGETPAGAYDVAVGVEDGVERVRRLAERMKGSRDQGSQGSRDQGTERRATSDERRVGSEAPVRRGGGLVAPGGGLVAPKVEDDSAVVDAVLAGREVVTAAVEVIRTRLGLAAGSPGVRFVAEGIEGGGATSDERRATSNEGRENLEAPVRRGGGLVAPGGLGAPVRVEVRHRGVVMGWLVSTEAGVPASALAGHAAWLGRWMALAAQQRALRDAAMLDELTGAYNRRYFRRYAEAALAQAAKDRNVVTLLLFDIDDFKGYNDRYGHAAGDEILTEVVKLLRSTIRPHDRVCRIGGDEFAVVFYEPQGPRDPGSKPPEDVHQIARRFQEQIRGHRFPKLGDCLPGTLTISGGLATYPWDGRTVEELLERADALALESKRAGKNAIRLGRE